MRKSASQKLGVAAAAAFGIILTSGQIGIPVVGAEGLPEGFKKGTSPQNPPPR